MQAQKVDASKNEPLIDTAEKLKKAVDICAKEKIISFDTEFIRESTFFPQLEWIQLATRKECWLIDCRAFKTAASIEPLLKLFTDPKILKVLHAAFGDQECLYTKYKVLATPILDTAVAASMLGLGESIGLGALTKEVLDVELSKGHARTDWSKRPLPKPLQEYALQDVLYLVELGEKLLAGLDEHKRRDWALKASAKFADPALYDSNPEEIATRLASSGRGNRKDYGLILELVRWRENRVRELNVPRRWLADDHVLIDLARVKPKTLEHLESFRGLSKGELKGKAAQQLLNAINLGVQSQAKPDPSLLPDKKVRPSPEETRGLELLKLYLSMLADVEKLSLKHLIETQDLPKLLRLDMKTVGDLRTSGLLTPGTSDEVIEKIFKFLKGKTALSLNGSKIQFK